MTTPVAVGIDVGTTNTKVALCDSKGPLRCVVAPTPTGAEALLDLILRGLRSVTAGHPAPRAIGIASMAEAGFPVGADGRALTPLISWQQDRGHAELDRLFDACGREELFGYTGVRPGPKPTLASLLWLRHRHPQLHDQLHRWAGSAEWVHLNLTGILRTDHTLAGRTLAYRLPTAGNELPPAFDAELLALAGLRPEQLAVVGRPTDPPDRLDAVAASATGLPPGTPVVVAGHDHQVAAWALGVRSPGDVADSVGTAEAVLQLVGEVPDRAGLLHQGMSLVRAVDGKTESVLGGIPSAGALLAQLAGTEDAFLSLTESDDAHLAGQGLLLPYPTGRQCPEPDLSARLRTIGDSKARPVVLAIEALSFQAAWIARVQAQFATGGVAAGPLTMIGESLARLPLWPRIKATLAPAGATRATPQEPVACGAALLALSRTGWVAPEATLPHSVVEPLPGLRERYLARLEAFIAAAR